MWGNAKTPRKSSCRELLRMRALWTDFVQTWSHCIVICMTRVQLWILGVILSEFTKWPYFSTGINLYWPWNRFILNTWLAGLSVMHNSTQFDNTCSFTTLTPSNGYFIEGIWWYMMSKPRFKVNASSRFGPIHPLLTTQFNSIRQNMKLLSLLTRPWCVISMDPPHAPLLHTSVVQFVKHCSRPAVSTASTASTPDGHYNRTATCYKCDEERDAVVICVHFLTINAKTMAIWNLAFILWGSAVDWLFSVFWDR